ncbi:MAG: hypothetical protein JNK05_26740 [Myxococcales bacterium]|nr:hypothetical protein [Myxococcales bacterium]
MACEQFDAVKVFSATTAGDRERLGERLTAWLRAQPKPVVIVDRAVLQSSDARFHCITIVLFYREG